MDIEFYKKEAITLKHRAEKVWESQSNDFKFINENLLNVIPDMNDVVMEFIHLVYSFDSNLPLNKYVDELREIRFPSSLLGSNANIDNKKKYDKIQYYIDFFIHYLDKYCK